VLTLLTPSVNGLPGETPGPRLDKARATGGSESGRSAVHKDENVRMHNTLTQWYRFLTIMVFSIRNARRLSPSLCPAVNGCPAVRTGPLAGLAEPSTGAVRCRVVLQEIRLPPRGAKATTGGWRFSPPPLRAASLLAGRIEPGLFRTKLELLGERSAGDLNPGAGRACGPVIHAASAMQMSLPNGGVTLFSSVANQTNGMSGSLGKSVHMSVQAKTMAGSKSSPSSQLFSQR